MLPPHELGVLVSGHSFLRWRQGLRGFGANLRGVGARAKGVQECFPVHDLGLYVGARTLGAGGRTKGVQARFPFHDLLLNPFGPGASAPQIPGASVKT